MGRAKKPPREFEIETLDLKKLKNDANILLVAPRRSGKSKIMDEIMYTKRNEFHRGVVFTKTQGEASNSLEDSIPASFIHDVFNQQALKTILSQVKQFSLWAKKTGIDVTKFKSGFFVIIEDFMSDKKELKKADVLDDLSKNGRHRGCFCMTTCQYSKDLKPDQREAADYVFILAHEQEAARKKLYDEFAPNVSFEEWCELMDMLTADFGCLVVDRVDKEHGIKYFKARFKLPRYTVGSKSFWKYHYQHFDKGSFQQPAWVVLKKKETEASKLAKSVADAAEAEAAEQKRIAETIAQQTKDAAKDQQTSKRIRIKPLTAIAEEDEDLPEKIDITEVLANCPPAPPDDEEDNVREVRSSRKRKLDSTEVLSNLEQQVKKHVVKKISNLEQQNLMEDIAIEQSKKRKRAD